MDIIDVVRRYFEKQYTSVSSYFCNTIIIGHRVTRKSVISFHALDRDNPLGLVLYLYGEKGRVIATIRKFIALPEPCPIRVRVRMDIRRNNTIVIILFGNKSLVSKFVVSFRMKGDLIIRRRARDNRSFRIFPS